MENERYINTFKKTKIQSALTELNDQTFYLEEEYRQVNYLIENDQTLTEDELLDLENHLTSINYKLDTLNYLQRLVLEESRRIK